MTQLDLYRIRLPLVSPFTTSFATETHKECYLVRAVLEHRGRTIEGWGESVAMEAPVYSAEYLLGGIDVTQRWLAPALFAEEDLSAESAAHAMRATVGHPMAKGALEMAVLDAQLRLAKQSFADYLGVTRTEVPSGVSVGIQDTVTDTVRAVGDYLEEGYARIKLKIQPGHDVEPVRAVRRAFGDEVPLQVDANAAYVLDDAEHLARLDEFGLLLIEQPLGESDLVQHSKLARRLTTPVCLDESIVSAQSAQDAIDLGAAAIINIKPGRVGGYLEAVKIHDLARAQGVPVWCGGMLETGVGRAANIALAAMDGFTITGDLSGSDRFFTQDITEPIVMRNGAVEVPTGVGFGVTVDPERLVAACLQTVSCTR